MELSTILPLAKDPHATAREVVALEKAGVDTVFLPEAYGFDAVSILGYLAARTSTVRLGPGILPIYSRTPALIAQTAAGLDAVSGGRAVLGLGASGPQVIEGWHGVPYAKPLARTREVVDICRRVWRREPLTNDGLYPLPLPEEQGTGLGKPLKFINRPVRERIPIFLAALGERNVQLTAEIAEGWLPIYFLPERAQEIWGPALDAGRARRDPALGELEIVAGGNLAIGDDVDQLLDLARPTLALYIGGMGARGKNFYNDLARRYGYEAEAERIQDLYLSGQRSEAEAAVPDELVRLTNLVGPESWVAERVAAYRAAGVTSLHVSPVGPDPMRSVERLKEMLS
ncbi:LLM class F420-dependent oxidoreductase [Phytoactinopolyspora halotolerans]|uniref:LLM class F420-dependent oxidoreductase n=1 Tax=Phytoactinopolyspora halotolerans TaxID=1981512 RepID=A0A6L9SJ91_9ACTN|nr:LLM class F420-dependent oxidoreductase [Phytoactinopolyspora halotolerans]NEE04744.1 LLM class F420-dependent oxidoreductase [Phytoactinopolyspora halotolerans]